jgi:hypothetical protein
VTNHQSLIIPTSNLPTNSIEKFDDYAATGGLGWYGELLKCSGKTGIWSYGPENVELKKGTRLVAIVPEMLAGYVLWHDGELVDQAFKNIEGLDLRALRATLGEGDRSLWLTDDDGRAIDPYKEAAMLPMKDPETGAEYTYSTSSVGGVRACKKLVGNFVKQIKAAPETTAGCLPLVELGVQPYQHPDRKRGTIFNPILLGIDWVRASEIAGLTSLAKTPTPPASSPTRQQALDQSARPAEPELPLTTVKKPSLKEEMGDEVPFNDPTPGLGKAESLKASAPPLPTPRRNLKKSDPKASAEKPTTRRRPVNPLQAG